MKDAKEITSTPSHQMMENEFVVVHCFAYRRMVVSAKPQARRV